MRWLCNKFQYEAKVFLIINAANIIHRSSMHFNVVLQSIYIDNEVKFISCQKLLLITIYIFQVFTISNFITFLAFFNELLNINRLANNC